jgi:SAM-dependent methyltransferase
MPAVEGSAIEHSEPGLSRLVVGMVRRVDELEASLAAYYDLEGAARQAMPLSDGRLAARKRFVRLMRAEGRHRVLDVGSGPGRDAVAFVDANLEVTAVDRSPGHVRLAADAGVRAVLASLLDLPFARGAFDASWAMSTLVHVPDDRWDRALFSIVSAVGPGAPIAIGLWGGVDLEDWQAPRGGLPARFFSRRNHDRVQAMLARHAVVESFDT